MKIALILNLFCIPLFIAPHALAADAEKITWDDLVTAAYQPDNIVQKYSKEIEILNSLEDGDPKGIEIMNRINADLNSAPMNEAMDGKRVQINGYIAPIEAQQGYIQRFLLVPYFGACIHVPAPPLNQTVLVTTKKNDAIALEHAQLPFQVTGTIKITSVNTDIGDAGYAIEQAQIEKSSDPLWNEEN